MTSDYTYYSYSGLSVIYKVYMPVNNQRYIMNRYTTVCESQEGHHCLICTRLFRSAMR